jgi:UDP-N-acetylmuramate dehydrogenase
MRGVADELRARVRGRVLEDEPLGPLTTFRVGGTADVFVEAASVDDLAAVGAYARDGVPIAIVGRGSNLLVSDDGFRGIALKLGRGFRVHDEIDGGLRLGGAVYLPAAARLTARLGLTGFEFAAEIPATFGGAVRMNAGAHDRSIADVLVAASVVDLGRGDERRVPTAELGYAYRHSELGPLDVVTGGELTLAAGQSNEVGKRIASYLDWRRAHQPPGRSAGSVFVNPPGDSAGRLIDEAGAKGMRIGGAEVSTVHANFIVASADATAADVWALIRRVQDMVAQRSGVELRPEVRFLGAFS